MEIGVCFQIDSEKRFTYRLLALRVALNVLPVQKTGQDEIRRVQV